MQASRQFDFCLVRCFERTDRQPLDFRRPQMGPSVAEFADSSDFDVFSAWGDSVESCGVSTAAERDFCVASPSAAEFCSKRVKFKIYRIRPIG